jgi:flagellar FliJ protein
MKFRFRLERLMRIRKIEEDVAQRDYAEALGRHDGEVAKLNSMYASLDETMGSRSSSIQGGGAVAARLTSMDFFLEGQEHRIEAQRRVIRGLKEIVEQKHQILIEKVKAHKAIEKLKERKKEDFKKQEGLRARRLQDEVSAVRFTKRNQSGGMNE